MPLEFTVRGRVVSESEAFRVLAEHNQPRPATRYRPTKTEDRAAASMSMGFAVLGYAPGAQKELEDAYAEAIKAHAGGAKSPGTLAEFEGRWLQKNKPKRIGRPYELRESAQQCADLAVKAGWSRVVVTEILRA